MTQVKQPDLVKAPVVPSVIRIDSNTAPTTSPTTGEGEMKMFFLFVSLMLSSCALFVDMSPKTRHQEWLLDMQQQVGRSVLIAKVMEGA